MDCETLTICTNMSAGSPKATKGIDMSSTLFDLKLVCLEWRWRRFPCVCGILLTCEKTKLPLALQTW
jgi:hypothetical protein